VVINKNLQLNSLHQLLALDSYSQPLAPNIHFEAPQAPVPSNNFQLGVSKMCQASPLIRSKLNQANLLNSKFHYLFILVIHLLSRFCLPIG
jgi:hypothetical protein